MISSIVVTLFLVYLGFFYALEGFQFIRLWNFFLLSKFCLQSFFCQIYVNKITVQIVFNKSKLPIESASAEFFVQSVSRCKTAF